MSTDKIDAIYSHKFTVSKSAIDRNKHVNNVVYVKWMQDVAIMHSDDNGGTDLLRDAKATWVARSHKIEYLAPAFENDEIMAFTWVESFRRVKSLRRYKFLRISDDKLLAKGETEWVLVDAETGRPKKIPDYILDTFPIHNPNNS